MNLFSVLVFLGASRIVLADIPPQNDLVPIAPPGSITFSSLWNSSGPAIDNIVQVKVYDCYWDAAMLAVLISSQNWIMNLFTYANGTSLIGVDTPSMDSVVVNLWNPNTLEPHSFTALLADESNTEDQPNSWWWGDALTQGIQQLAATTNVDGIFPNGSFIPYEGSGAIVLTILTGYNNSIKYKNDYKSSDDFFTDLQRVPSTPLVMSTIGYQINSNPPVEGNHDYAIMMANVTSDGTKTVTARNPWGATDVFNLEDLWDGMYCLNYLTGWKELKWPGH